MKREYKKNINHKNLQRYLNKGTNELGTETFFNNIKKLKQAHYLILKDGQITIRNYFRLSVSDSLILKNDQEYAERFRELFIVSIKRRLRSDVPVGTSLSGGLDSSSIVCFIDKLLGPHKVQKTFSARFKDPQKDEGKWIDIVVKKAKTEHHEIFPDPAEFSNEVNKIIYHHEYPLGSTSNFAHYYVMWLARKNGITVILDGQGADEYLAGYDPYRQYALWELFYKYDLTRFKQEQNLFRSIYGSKINLGYMYVLRTIAVKLIFPQHNDNILYRSLKAKLRFDLNENLAELLAYADRNSMAHSVEARLPFLYHELVQFVLSLPVTQIYRNATTKWVLRSAIKGTVPEEIVNRRDKLGYSPPQQQWMKILNHTGNNLLQKEGYRLSDNSWRNYSAIRFLETFK